MEYGLDQLTDEELAASQPELWRTPTLAISIPCKTQYFADTDLTGEELTALRSKPSYLEIGYSSRETLLDTTEEASKELAKLRDMIVKDVSVSEDEITAQYNDRRCPSR